IRSLLGTQIAPEDVSGIPHIVNERSVFCPPRILLPETPEPFCLFLDEFPAAAPDVQKALYALLLERRLGEHQLPEGTWVVAAGNRQEDRALVRQMSSALVNRTFILQVEVNVKEWLVWAQKNKIREEILSFITFMPEALMRAVPKEPVPFSTPRAWASLSSALNLAEEAGILNRELFRALAFGRVSAADASIFCTVAERELGAILPIGDYIFHPEKLPQEPAKLWFVLNWIRERLTKQQVSFEPEVLNTFLMSLPQEHRFALFADRVYEWGNIGVKEAMFESLSEVTGLV
ncbi:MAG: ATP-binding protein, partial [Bacteroidetes bacterium]|nr:ATP-binding protein [Bacteroidota bacterium]